MSRTRMVVERQRTPRSLPLVVLGLCVVLVVGLAVVGEGVTDRELVLNNAGVWVTSDKDGLFGRVNRSAGRVDAALMDPVRDPGRVELDVLQDQEAVVGWTRSQSRLFPVDTRDGVGVGDGAVSLAMDGAVAMGGGVIAVVGDDGQLRVTRYVADGLPDLSGLGPDRVAVASVGVPRRGVGAVGVAVDGNGVVFAASVSGDTVMVEASGRVVTGSVGQGLGSVAVSLVGGVGIVTDPTSGDVFLSTGGRVQVGARVTPQQASVAGDKVVVATDGGLTAISLPGGQPSTIYELPDLPVVGGRVPAAPVVTSSAVYGAWSGTPGRVVRLTADPKPGVWDFPRDGSALVKPVFRVNRGSVLVNDMANGAVFDVDDAIQLEEWTALQEPQIDTNDNELDPQDRHLQVRDDHLWARAGRQSVLHVLDNDDNPGDGIVAITSVSGNDVDKVVISPDGQTLLVTVPPDQVQDMHVAYSVGSQSDVAGQEPGGKGDVTISVRAPTDNASPNLFGLIGRDEMTADFTVASGGVLSVAPGWAWRDADSDPVNVVSASFGGRVLPVSAQGVIRFSAPVSNAPALEKVSYVVSDGLGEPVEGFLVVQVLASGATQGVAPRAMSDSVRGVVGRPVSFYPLDNDVPGADPLNRQAALALAGPVAGRPGIEVVGSDVASGEVTVVADAVGTWFLDYTVTFGSQVAMGKIRVEVVADDGLVAVPDAAVVRGVVAVNVDVLSNDHDGFGSVLTVVSAVAAAPERVQVGVVGGRWLRVGMLSSVISAAPSRVDYTVVNGLGEQATGQLWVTQAPAVVADHVSVVDDYVTVRAGDVTAMSVLANDSSTSGLPLVINDNVPGLPAGQLLVEDPSAPGGQATQDVGEAFVDGGRVRYVAPAGVNEPRLLRIEYQAGVPMGSPMTGHVWVNLVPDTGANRPPVPALVEARAMAGDTITIAVDTYNQDPDGDSVTVTGLASAPQAGRVTAVSANSFTYEAYPGLGKPGTDTFQFYVQDRFGAVGIGTVRVGLSPLGVRPAPMAVDDVITAQPGASVIVYPATNDVISPGTRNLTVVLDSDLPGVILDQPSRTVRLVAPAANTSATSVGYHLDEGGVPGVSAQVVVRGQEGYLNPPNVYDQVATDVVEGRATADVLRHAWDVDGEADQIKVVSVGGDATFDGAVVSVPVTGLSQVVPFVVEDGTGARAAGVVFVPGTTGGRPSLKAGGRIQLDNNGTKTVSLGDYIESPRGRPVHLTDASQAWASPAVNLNLTVESDQRITLTAGNNYSGPAALTVEVRDSPNSDDPDAVTGVVAIPVQIGPPTPVLWCPDTPVEVVQGGVPVNLDVAGVCRVWSPEPGALWQFDARWVSGGDGITLGGRDGSALPSDQVSVQATSASGAGSASMLEVSVDGYELVSARFVVRVVGAPRPVLRVSSVVDVRQGSVVSVPVVVSSPLVDGVPHIVSVIQTSGPAGVVSFDDRVVRVTPDAASHGVLSFDVVGSDVPDDARVDRQVRGSFTVSVFGVPDAPSPPQPGLVLRSGSAVVSFVPGADNGSPVMEYQLQWDGGNRSCGLNTTCEVPGLVNGTAYRFQVRAVNKAGPSVWSELGPEVVPNALPGRVTGFGVAAQGCGSVTLKWTGVDGDGSPVTTYYLSWTGQMVPVKLPGSATSHEVTGLTNGSPYTFTIVAENEAGLGPVSAPVDVVPACQPQWKAGDKVSVKAANVGETAAVTVSWPAVDPRGPEPVTYQVTRTGGQGPEIRLQTTGALRVDDTGIVYDGTTYSYTVTASNGGVGTPPSDPLPTAQWRAVDTPKAWSTAGGLEAVSAAANGRNGEIEVAVNRFPDFRDARGNVRVTIGTDQVTLDPGHATGTFTGLANSETVNVLFAACNSAGCNAEQRVSAGGPFGDLEAPSFDVWNGTGREVCFSASGNGNGREATLQVTLGGNDVFKQPPKSAGQISIPAQCLDGNAWDADVTLGVSLQSLPTTPARSGPDPVHNVVHTPAGVPDAWADGDVSLTNPGDGTLKLDIAKVPAANGGTVTVYVTWTVGGVTTGPVVVPSDGVIRGLDPGAEVTVEVSASNGRASNSPVVLKATPYKNLEAPRMVQDTGTETLACVQAGTPSGGTGGLPATLVITVNGADVIPRVLRSGEFDAGQVCYDTGGYSKSVTFTAQLLAGPGQTRGDSPKTTVVATSPAEPPWGPMTLYDGTGRQSGGPISKNTEVCVTFTADAGGAAARLNVKNDQDAHADDSDQGTGTLSVRQCAKPSAVFGPGNGGGLPVKFTATLVDLSTHQRDTQTKPLTVYAPDNPDDIMSLASYTPQYGEFSPDKRICLTYRVATNGHPVTAEMTAAGDGFDIIDYPGPVTQSGSEPFTLYQCYDTGGAGLTVNFTVTLLSPGGEVLTVQSFGLTSAF